jgi:ankyrin repeat protein
VQRVVLPEDVPKVETDPGKLLARALLYRDAGQVARILKEHPDLVEKPISDARPLWRACETRSVPLVKAVVEAGADVNAANGEKKTPLWAAVASDSLDVVKYLVSKGADPKAYQEDERSTLLWEATSREMAEFLIGAGVEPKYKNGFGDTALHEACKRSHVEVAELLLDRGLDVEQPGRWDMRPLHCAASTVTGDPRSTVMMLLRRGADINARGYRGHTAVHECALFDRLEMAALLLGRGAKPDVKDNDGRTPMEAAELVGRGERARIINLLIKHGAKGTIVPLPKG